ncbi:MAG: hypothetical protein SF052_11780 [Bacteroidia bacterium]|nr:hypothetical protein [Bacteroidia bacterium]
MNRISTSTRYWLEIWTKEEKFREVSRAMGNKNPGEPRSIIRLYETRQPDEPQWFEINSFLDILDDKYDALENAGVSRNQVSIWLNCQYEEDECKVALDPLTLLRLGQEGIRLCVTCSRDETDGLLTPETIPPFVSRLVEIRDIHIENEQEDKIDSGLGGTEVTVGFDDGTAWVANFISLRQLNLLVAAARNHTENGQSRYFWLPNMVIIGELSRDEIERAIIHLLRLGKFEQAFAPLEALCEREQEEVVTELSLIHEAGFLPNIEEILGIHEPYIVSSGNFWAVKKIQTSGQPSTQYISHFLDLLEGKYTTLAEAGIQRRDISINWSYRYEEHCNLEFAPEVLERLGRNGIALNVYLRQAAKVVVREV